MDGVNKVATVVVGGGDVISAECTYILELDIDITNPVYKWIDLVDDHRYSRIETNGFQKLV